VTVCSEVVRQVGEGPQRLAADHLEGIDIVDDGQRFGVLTPCIRGSITPAVHTVVLSVSRDSPCEREADLGLGTLPV
jgi:hypothetical protein